MNCIRCRSNEALQSTLCSICHTIKPDLSTTEEYASVYYHFDDPKYRSFFADRGIITRQMAEIYIDNALEGDNRGKSDYAAFYGLDQSTDANDDLIDRLIDFSNPNHLCEICSIPRWKACDHLPVVDKIIMMQDRDQYDQSADIIDMMSDPIKKYLLKSRNYAIMRNITESMKFLELAENESWNNVVVKRIIFIIRKFLNYRGDYSDIEWVFNSDNLSHEVEDLDLLSIKYTVIKDLFYEVLRYKVFQLNHLYQQKKSVDIEGLYQFTSTVFSYQDLKFTNLEVARICLLVARIREYVNDTRVDRLLNRALEVFEFENYERGSVITLLIKSQLCLHKFQVEAALELLDSLNYGTDLELLEKSSMMTIRARAYAMQHKHRLAIGQIDDLFDIWKKLPDSLIKTQVFVPVLHVLRESGYEAKLEEMKSYFQPLANKYGQLGEHANSIRYQTDLF